MKKEYNTPSMEVTSFATESVIMVSAVNTIQDIETSKKNWNPDIYKQ